MAGRELIAPDGQRINPERLRVVRVVVVDLAAYRLNGADAS